KKFELNDEQKANLTALWTDEGIPTVMLHHAFISHPDFPLFREVFGAQYLLKETEIDGRKYAGSSYLKPTELKIYITDRKHPITEGVADFQINDEVFKDVYYNPKIDVLARTDHPKSDAPVVWTWHYKNTPVFGMIQGDDGGAFDDPNYRKLFYQGLRWVVDEKKK
ncbi:MAG: ThuA domain-containing protein, partial [Thermoguttaceae bacterium]|nr:ThuA domain-containing protein [Thermoguttaceae bacterium]